jgi:M6 family metalloprotease-like protein
VRTPCSPSLLSAPFAGLNEGTTPSSLALAPAQRLSAVMLFVDFAKLRGKESPRRLVDQLVPRTRAWYAAVSYGRVNLEISAPRRWFKMPRLFRAYGLADGVTWAEQRSFIADAVAAADKKVDFSRFRIVYVVSPLGTGIERSQAFLSYDGSGIRADGTELRHGATLFEDIRSSGATVVVHETGHLFGLPDLYDLTSPSSLFRFAGGWDVMSQLNDLGPPFLAWERWKLGWLDPAQLACLNGPGELATTIAPVEETGGLKAVVVPTGQTSALVVEARRRKGLDRSIGAEGLLIYSVDADVGNGQGPVRVRAARKDRDQDAVARCGPLYDAPFNVGPGRVGHFGDEPNGISIDVLGLGPGGYQVRVRRTSLAVVPFGLAWAGLQA